MIVEPLSAKRFGAYGDVIEMPADGGRVVNFGTALRFDHLAGIDVQADGGEPTVSLFRVQPATFPLRVASLERHPLSTQMFMPLSSVPFLVIVALCAADGSPSLGTVRAFVTNGMQGINYRRGIWHHPLIALSRQCDFLMLGRKGGGVDYESIELSHQSVLIVEPPLSSPS